jgi:hypothetical protein
MQNLSKSMSAYYANGLLRLALPLKGMYAVRMFDSRGRQVAARDFMVAENKVVKTTMNIGMLPYQCVLKIIVDRRLRIHCECGRSYHEKHGCCVLVD